MKVLHLFDEIKFSGAEIMYSNAAYIFQNDGIELFAFSTGRCIGDFSSEFEKNNIKIYHKEINFMVFSIKWIKYYIFFLKFLKNEKIDVLHIHRSNLYTPSFVSWIAKVRCIKTQHNTFKNPWYSLPYQIFMRYIDRNIYKVSYHTIGESVYLNELKVYKNPSVRINNWFDSKKFYPTDGHLEKKLAREMLNLNDNSFIVISVGGCSHIKNHFDVITAVSYLQNKLDCTYLHLGEGGTEEEEKKYAEKLCVESNVKFLGNQIDVRKYLIAADVFVMTSKFEGLGNVVLEAMACGLPAILYDVPGLRDLIKNDDNGFLIEQNTHLLAKKIMYLFYNPDVANKMGKKAVYYVNKEFSMPLNVKQIISLYKDVY